AGGVRARDRPARRALAAAAGPGEALEVRLDGPRLLGVNAYAAVAVALLVIALFVLPPAYGQFLPQRISDYLIFGLPALAVGLSVSFGLDPLQGSGFYWLLCAVTVLWLLLSWYLLSSRAGRIMTAIGRNPVRAAAMGYSVYAYRVAVTLYSGAIAASAGWLYALAHAFVFPDLLGLGDSVNFVLYSLVGGVDTVLG